MSIESMAIALNHSRAKGNARVVLIGIANHDGDGGSWPSIATLSKYAGGLDRKNIKRAIDKLEELGEVRQHDMAGGDNRTPDHLRPNRYEFLLRCPEWCDRTAQHRDNRKPLVTFNEQADAGVYPGATAPRGRQRPGGDSAPGGGAVAPPEPSKNLTTHVDKETHVPNRAREAACAARGGRPHRPEPSGYCSDCGADTRGEVA